MYETSANERKKNYQKYKQKTLHKNSDPSLTKVTTDTRTMTDIIFHQI